MSQLEAERDSIFASLSKRTIGRFADHPQRFRDSRVIFGDVIPVILDNGPFPLVTKEQSGYNASFLESIIPLDLRKRLLGEIRDWETGDARGKVFIVGESTSGSNHPHLSEVMKLDGGIRLLFVDPEDNVGRRNLVKPRVNVLAAAVIHDDIEYTTQFAYLRYRSEHLPKDRTLQAQYRIAEQLIDNGGIPPILVGQENNILFQLALLPQGSTISTRYALPFQLSRFLNRERGIGYPLEMKLTAIKDTVNLFPIVLGEQDENSIRYSKVIHKLGDIQK
ncbi:hypothetical protein HY407_02545 [Candidatus Gottesmanbacteria bacterium]|nr:hypothetical protein [Candidatus Gottesmanbacteria bacterium]